MGGVGGGGGGGCGILITVRLPGEQQASMESPGVVNRWVMAYLVDVYSLDYRSVAVAGGGGGRHGS